MKPHELADIFPLMNQKEYAELKLNIKEHGLIKPIIVYEGKILDGRNRYTVCKELGIKLKTKDYDLDMVPLEYVMSVNLKRRQLTPSQKAVVGIRYKIYYSKIYLNRKDNPFGKHSKVSTGNQGVVEPVPSETARDRAGEVVGVSGKYIDEAEKLIKECPKAENQIMKEGKAITIIKREIKEDKAEEKRREDKIKADKIQSPEELFKKIKFTTILIDPPWDWNDEEDNNQFGRAKPKYTTIPFNELKKLPIPKITEKNSHIYLCVTNRSLPKGFELLKEWGYRYITCLTWCKPSFGMGNYFRGSTEQILFGVKGSLSLKKKNVGTWFQAKRGDGGHSSKPDELYALVEDCSPGLYLDYFKGKKRKGWYVYGI